MHSGPQGDDVPRVTGHFTWSKGRERVKEGGRRKEREEGKKGARKEGRKGNVGREESTRL